MGFPPFLNLSTRLFTAALPGQTTKTALTEEFMFQNVAYRPTVYRTGVNSKSVLIRPTIKAVNTKISKNFFCIFFNILISLFSDLCVFKNVFWNSVYHSGILELPTNEYSWSHWLPYCKFAETNRNFGNTASFLYHVHNAIYIVVSWQSFAKI